MIISNKEFQKRQIKLCFNLNYSIKLNHLAKRINDFDMDFYAFQRYQNSIENRL